MNKTTSQPRTLVLVSMIFIAAIARLIPHPWNFTPIAAMALFGGVYFSNKLQAFAVTILSLLLSDVLTIVFINNSFTSLSKYMVSLGELSIIAGFIITVSLGIIISNRTSVRNLIGASHCSSVIFFLLTNMAVWNNDPLYPQNFSGLIACYVAGLPFFRNEILGDLFYTAVLFSSFFIVRMKFPRVAEV